MTDNYYIMGENGEPVLFEDRPKQVEGRGTSEEAEVVHWDFIPVDLPENHPLNGAVSIACGASHPYLPDRHSTFFNEVTCPDCVAIAGGVASLPSSAYEVQDG